MNQTIPAAVDATFGLENSALIMKLNVVNEMLYTNKKTKMANPSEFRIIGDEPETFTCILRMK